MKIGQFMSTRIAQKKEGRRTRAAEVRRVEKEKKERVKRIRGSKKSKRPSVNQSETVLELHKRSPSKLVTPILFIQMYSTKFVYTGSLSVSTFLLLPFVFVFLFSICFASFLLSLLPCMI